MDEQATTPEAGKPVTFPVFLPADRYPELAQAHDDSGRPVHPMVGATICMSGTVERNDEGGLTITLPDGEGNNYEIRLKPYEADAVKFALSIAEQVGR
jgi:hypothetical protein